MYYTDRLHLVQEYKEWLELQNSTNNFTLCGSYETFLVFLELKGLLNNYKYKKEGD